MLKESCKQTCKHAHKHTCTRKKGDVCAATAYVCVCMRTERESASERERERERERNTNTHALSSSFSFSSSSSSSSSPSSLPLRRRTSETYAQRQFLAGADAGVVQGVGHVLHGSHMSHHHDNAHMSHHQRSWSCPAAHILKGQCPGKFTAKGHIKGTLRMGA